MESILLHCPLNISRTLSQMMVDFCETLRKKYGNTLELEIQPHRPEEKSELKACLEKGRMPAMAVGHVDDLADLSPGVLEKLCLALPGRFPLRKELADLGFGDARGYFHLFSVVPFAMFYNPTLVAEDQVPASWKDLLSPRWRGKIRMPDPFRIVSAVVGACLQDDFPDEFKQFEQNAVQAGSPPEVVADVDAGNFPIGITNIAFARISRQKNTRIIWPKDGLFCMPQAMVFGRDASPAVLEIGDYLLSPAVQEYLAMQSFVPASPEVALHPLVAENHCNLRWKGWDSFLSVVSARH